MERRLMQCVVACAGLAWAGSVLAQPFDIDNSRVIPPVPGQIGTSDIYSRGLGGGIALPVNGQQPKAPRVGVLAYCSDITPNAATYGLMTGQNAGVTGGWSRSGQFGAQNLVDMLNWDDGIPRFKDVVLIDGDRDQPTAADLARNFDCVIAFTDKQCGIPIPPAISIQAGNALATFARTPGKGVVLTGFAFSSSIGFGDAIFAPGLSPLRKGGPANDPRCTRPGPLTNSADEAIVDVPGPCPIGSCQGLSSPVPGGVADPNGVLTTACTPQGVPAQCLDAAGNPCGRPNYQWAGQPYPSTPDLACDHMLSQVDGPTSSSWATALTNANVDPSATACFSYDIPGRGGAPLPLLAINRARNVVAVNTFPPDASDINKFWYQCMIGNAVQYACGLRTKCTARGCPLQ